MKKKCNTLALWSFVLALAIFLVSYMLYHHLTPEGFSPAFQSIPGKPMLTLLFGGWGVLFLFAGCLSLLIGHIFFKEK